MIAGRARREQLQGKQYLEDTCWVYVRIYEFYCILTAMTDHCVVIERQPQRPRSKSLSASSAAASRFFLSHNTSIFVSVERIRPRFSLCVEASEAIACKTSLQYAPRVGMQQIN